MELVPQGRREGSGREGTGCLPKGLRPAGRQGAHGRVRAEGRCSATAPEKLPVPLTG